MRNGDRRVTESKTGITGKRGDLNYEHGRNNRGKSGGKRRT
jgi:hypothetical protein